MIYVPLGRLSADFPQKWSLGGRNTSNLCGKKLWVNESDHNFDNWIALILLASTIRAQVSYGPAVEPTDRTAAAQDQYLTSADRVR